MLLLHYEPVKRSIYRIRDTQSDVQAIYFYIDCSQFSTQLFLVATNLNELWPRLVLGLPLTAANFLYSSEFSEIVNRIFELSLTFPILWKG